MYLPASIDSTLTPAECAKVTSAPQVTVDDAISSATPASFRRPGRHTQAASHSTFTVYTGVVINGVFTAEDEAFNVSRSLLLMPSG